MNNQIAQVNATAEPDGADQSLRLVGCVLESELDFYQRRRQRHQCHPRLSGAAVYARPAKAGDNTRSNSTAALLLTITTDKMAIIGPGDQAIGIKIRGCYIGRMLASGRFRHDAALFQHLHQHAAVADGGHEQILRAWRRIFPGNLQYLRVIQRGQLGLEQQQRNALAATPISSIITKADWKRWP